MKLAFMTFACPEWPLDRIIEGAVEHRYDGVEFRCDAGHGHGVEVWASEYERKRIRSRLAGAGVEPCCLATSLRLLSDESMELAESRLKLAVDIGCGAMRIFCGAPPLGMEEDILIPYTGSRLRHLAQLAEHWGVRVLLETHDAVPTAKLAAAVVTEAAHPMAGVSYDNAQAARRGEPLSDAAEALAGTLRYCHFHDAMNRADRIVITPFGEGELPIDETFTMLLNLPYDGYLSGEWFADQLGPDPDGALALYRQGVIDLCVKHDVSMR